jgi:hypothetical protein
MTWRDLIIGHPELEILEQALRNRRDRGLRKGRRQGDYRNAGLNWSDQWRGERGGLGRQRMAH